MELVKLVGIMGASGASFASGSALSDTSLHLFPGQASHGTAPAGKHFQDFDLSCVKSDNWNNRQIFPYLTDYSLRPKLKEDVNDKFTISTFNLQAPSGSATGEVKACLRTTFSQTEAANKTVAVTMEMAAARDNYGIVLLNSIANKKDNEGKKSIFRAIFLEKGKDEYRWKIKEGIEWSDEAFKSAKKLTWSGLSDRTVEINWEDQASDPLKKDPFSVSWKKDDQSNNTGKNIYQHLTIKADPSTTQASQGFWNGGEEPLKSSTTLKPSAVFMDGVWTKAPDNADVTKAKDWFNLFKDDKGTWSA